MATPEDLVSCISGASNKSEIYEITDNGNGTYTDSNGQIINTRAGSNPYVATTPADWPTPVPDSVSEALDCLAERECITGNLFISSGADNFSAPYAAGQTAVNGELTITNPSKWPAGVSISFIFANTNLELPNNNGATSVQYQVDFGTGSFTNVNTVGSDHHGGLTGTGVQSTTTVHNVIFSGFSQTFFVCLDSGESITVRSRKIIAGLGENGADSISTASSSIRYLLTA